MLVALSLDILSYCMYIMFLDVTHQHSDKNGFHRVVAHFFLRGAPAPHPAKMAIVTSPAHPWPEL